MDTPSNIPEEDRWLRRPIPIRTKPCDQGYHEYVDIYNGWAFVENFTQLKVWVFCKKCLDKQRLTFDTSDFELGEEDDWQRAE